jgi:hypothetical protein
MIVEHWTDDGSTQVFPAGEFCAELFDGAPVKCCEITGESWEDCMRQYHEHMRWARYVPMITPRSPTGHLPRGSDSPETLGVPEAPREWSTRSRAPTE